MDEFMTLVCIGFFLCGFILGAPTGWIFGRRDAYESLEDDGYGTLSDFILNFDEDRLAHEESLCPEESK